MLIKFDFFTVIFVLSIKKIDPIYPFILLKFEFSIII